MKNLLVYFLIFSSIFCQGQNDDIEGSLQLNHLLDPVETEVVFDFGKGLLKETDFDLDYRRMILNPLNKDTTLEMGTRNYRVIIPLERPTLIRLQIADQWDHLFLIPGQTTHVVYNPLKENQDRIDVISQQNVVDINKYYDDRFKLLGVSREILQAYQVYNYLYLKPMEAKIEYDSLAQKQYNLLNKFSHLRPKWFVEFENKSIKYITEN